MQLTLYDKNGREKARFSPSDSSTQTKEIQGDNVLGLSFTLYEFVAIDVNDYIDYEGERYRALEKYKPSEKSTVEWEYSVQFYGVESLIKRFLVLNNTDGDNEAVFTLTDKPSVHLALIVRCINEGMASMGTARWVAGAIDNNLNAENVVIDYHGKYCDEALRELAEAVGSEWYIEGTTVSIGRCEFGEPLTLGYGEGKGLTSLDRDRADNAKFYTRLFPIGSSRNIDPSDYNGHTRLQLPGGAKYVDVNTDEYGIIHHYEQEAFAGIYPRRIGGERDRELVELYHRIAAPGLRSPMVVYHLPRDLRLHVRNRLGRAVRLEASRPDRRHELHDNVLHGVVRLVASAPHGIGAHDGREGGVERRPCLVVILLDVRADRIIYLFHV